MTTRRAFVFVLGTAALSVPLRSFAQQQKRPVIGYLARQCEGKGLHTLVDAFILLAPKLPNVRLAIAGTATSVDSKYIAQQQQKLKDAGLWDRVTWKRNVSIEEKIAHLRSLTVLSVPATYGEAFGLYVVEALACGMWRAIASIKALAENLGPAPRAFLIVPIVGAFLIDFPNALIITTFINFYK